MADSSLYHVIYRGEGEGMEDFEPAVLASSGKRRYRSTEEKRAIIEETLRPGASVAVVARAHQVNANQLFHWRKLYRAGLLNPETGGVRLLPVRVREDVEKGEGAVVKREAAEVGTIEVSLARSQVRIVGQASAELVCAILECLSR
jgi:transposase